MKHLTFTDKSLLVGDEVAQLLLDYAVELGSQSKADTVTVRGIGSDGDEVEAVYLLNEGTNLMMESVRTSVPEPDNDDTLAYLREHLDALRNPPVAPVEDFRDAEASDFDY